MRGKLILRQDHLLDIYLPGVYCQSPSAAPLSLVCRGSDDPWPLSSQFALGGFYAATRNFFTGVLSPGVGKQSSTAKFYSAAPLPRPSYTLWIFAGVDGTVRLLDGVTEQTARLNWGSDLASVKSSCGSGWQVSSHAAGRQFRGLGAGIRISRSRADRCQSGARFRGRHYRAVDGSKGRERDRGITQCRNGEL